MQLSQQLIQIFGLTENEAEVYVYGLGVSFMTAQDISLAKNIPRPTVYHVLETLVQMGFVVKTGTEKKTVVSVVHPKLLPSLLQREKTEIENRQNAFDAMLPSLLKDYAKKSHDLVSLQYEGLSGVKLLFEEALYAKNRSWDIIAPSHNILREEPKYAAYVYETQRTRGIKLRTLWENKTHDKKHSTQEIARRNIRLMPEAMTGKFSSLIVLFDDACAFFPPREESSAILLRSQEIHATFEAIFEGLWHLGEEYKNI